MAFRRAGERRGGKRERDGEGKHCGMKRETGGKGEKRGGFIERRKRLRGAKGWKNISGMEKETRRVREKGSYGV